MLTNKRTEYIVINFLIKVLEAYPRICVMSIKMGVLGKFCGLRFLGASKYEVCKKTITVIKWFDGNEIKHLGFFKGLELLLLS